MNKQIADDINTLSRFCGVRDVPELTSDELRRKYGISRADVMVLFGGSIIAGGDETARAMANGVARKYVIVGGAGHTTETLREKMRLICPDIAVDGLSEAEIFQNYLRETYGLQADYLETKSTNCGNNITYLLQLLEENGVECKSIILCQDASMQHRMDAGLRKYVSDDMTIINYAAYEARVVCDGDTLRYTSDIRGMWTIERYTELLMGEIPRLTDDGSGYGPTGKDFISHVDVPDDVRDAFRRLCKNTHVRVRAALDVT